MVEILFPETNSRYDFGLLNATILSCMITCCANEGHVSDSMYTDKCALIAAEMIIAEPP